MKLADTIDTEIEAAREPLFGLCARLVAAESVSPPGLTAGVAAIVRDWLAEAGVAVETVAADVTAPNIVGSVVGAGAGRHVVFNAHMDTMEAGDLARWTVPPLTLTRRDGRAYGLGMGNMKGALAAMCLATVLLHRHRDALSGRLSLTAVSDEVMFGDRGTVYLLAQRPDLAGDYLISGEGPGFMELAVAEKGLLWLDAETSGEGGHSSGALAGCTATMRLAAFLAALDGLNEVFAMVPPELEGVSGGEGEVGLRLSLNAGTLNAGTVRSQIATRATAQIDIRLPPGIAADEAEGRVRAHIPDGLPVTLARVKAWDANWTSLDHPLTRAVAAAAEQVRGVAPRPVVRLPGSDARRWRDLGVPSLCFGPQPTLSAGIDDFAYEQDVVDCAKIYARSAIALMAG
ncbi:M20 family metallopeptidase [Flavisphingomonas formosensis]|uniref:M20 family metallopeptidase n=1 Tax=Flavisphingomonas formosensis TaxID=861534 RepID=UPI0012FB58AC|nr:M20/M25/M40 family metallo-hydrolase [Sphingomonas formosensis]